MYGGDDDDGDEEVDDDADKVCDYCGVFILSRCTINYNTPGF